ncbi:MAG: DeoR/GlpR transcriptional regulator [Clostridiales bacterium]|nr:DeoR/GlpR transcriptional regulator [Clostridiales bacterium]OPZ67800.1 MAG: Glycerol-3-phosphate regulon repressor [Firmicutes bacterium ADurb.Bin467]
MIREERLAKITEYINACRYARIDDLVDYIGVSKPTIRRDLTELCNRGKINFVRGGATSVSEPEKNGSGSTFDPTETNSSNVLARQRIAAEAAKLVQPGDKIFLCAGRTTREMAKHLKDMRHISVVTNDFIIAAELYRCENIGVMMAGGEVKDNRGVPSTCGFASEDFISKLRVNAAFLSCDSVDVHSGCYILNPGEVGLMRGVLANASRHIVMADHDKFSSNAFVSICKMDEIDVLVTDVGLSEDLRELLAKTNVKTLYA